LQFSWQGGQDEGLEEELEGMSEVEVWKERPHGNISFTLSTFDSAEKKNFHSRPIAHGGFLQRDNQFKVRFLRTKYWTFWF
jgi:hypothetical protein